LCGRFGGDEKEKHRQDAKFILRRVFVRVEREFLSVLENALEEISFSVRGQSSFPPLEQAPAHLTSFSNVTN
jgi:hypothetical protein